MPDILNSILQWAWIVVPVSMVMFVGTLFLIPILLIRLPADYFISDSVRGWHGRHPRVHWTWVIGKNLIGMILLGSGIAMLVLPGQGLLTILLGIVLMDFPGKRRLERRLIQYKPLSQSANWLRRRYDRPPFELEKNGDGNVGGAGGKGIADSRPNIDN